MRKTKAQIKRAEAAKRGWETRKPKISRLSPGAHAQTFNSAPGQIKWEQKGDTSKQPIKVFIGTPSGDVGYEEDNRKMGTLTSIAIDTNNTVAKIEDKLRDLLYTLRDKFDRNAAVQTGPAEEKAESRERQSIPSNFTRATVGLMKSLELIDQIDKLQDELI